MKKLNDDGLKQLFTDLISDEFYLKEDVLLKILRNRGCSDKYKLVMWMASKLHPKREYKVGYYESLTGATKNEDGTPKMGRGEKPKTNIIEQLDIKIDNANKALKQIEKEGIFYREGHKGQRMRKWMIGDKKNHVEPVKSSKTKFDGFTESSIEEANKIKCLYDTDKLEYSREIKKGMPQVIDRSNPYNFYQVMLEAHGINSTSTHDDRDIANQRVEGLNNATKIRITNGSVIGKYIVTTLYPILIQNKKLKNSEAYFSRFIDYCKEQTTKEN